MCVHFSRNLGQSFGYNYKTAVQTSSVFISEVSRMTALSEMSSAWSTGKGESTKPVVSSTRRNSLFKKPENDYSPYANKVLDTRITLKTA